MGIIIHIRVCGEWWYKRLKSGGKHSQKYDKSVYQSLALITQFGMNMLVPIGMMSALGIWLDKKLDASIFTIFLFFVGALAGGQNVFRMAKKVYGTQGTSGKEQHNDQSRGKTEKDGQDSP